jgi:hypothetical protein
MSQKKVQYKEYVITLYGQRMHDGRWSPKAVMTFHGGSYSEDRTIIGEELLDSEEEAEKVAMAIAKNSIDKGG